MHAAKSKIAAGTARVAKIAVSNFCAASETLPGGTAPRVARSRIMARPSSIPNEKFP